MGMTMTMHKRKHLAQEIDDSISMMSSITDDGMPHIDTDPSSSWAILKILGYG